MSVGCIIFLAISLSAGCVSCDTREEIAAVLAGSISAVCMVVSLVLAPWLVKLLVVFAMLVASKRLIPDDPHHVGGS
ncbi:hypothetical protein [Phormidium sp. CCY1219]|uniref:hypothetical protein n=1 Tax=Phormidium sp. CCY1219 TaxID=2886104 RepID=UPI002D1F3185|nr:hypothetical protein [Phormidium sp. CCY1219]MEB3829540.1 hypothetical protein [Phormidium sp. CCY1219]